MKLVGSLMAAVSLMAAPVAAAPANPAGSLSVAGHARAGSPTADAARLAGGGGLYVAIIAVIALSITVGIVASHKDHPRSP